MKELYGFICQILLIFSFVLSLSQQYTCYDASFNYIVCGATSGSLYLFQRQQNCKFLQLIPNLSGAINNVAISPQEHYIAFTTQKGTILVYVIDLTTVQPVVISSYYREMTVTQLKWKQNECQLFLGDMKGNVFLANLNNFLVSYALAKVNKFLKLKLGFLYRVAI